MLSCANGCVQTPADPRGAPKAELPTVQRWDLLAYTNLGQPKYHRLDLPYGLEGALLLTQAEMEALHAVARQRVDVAVWSGATRQE